MSIAPTLRSQRHDIVISALLTKSTKPCELHQAVFVFGFLIRRFWIIEVAFDWNFLQTTERKTASTPSPSFPKERTITVCLQTKPNRYIFVTIIMRIPPSPSPWLMDPMTCRSHNLRVYSPVIRTYRIYPHSNSNSKIVIVIPKPPRRPT